MSRTNPDRDFFVKTAKVISTHGVHGAIKLRFFPGGIFDLGVVTYLTFHIHEHFIDYEIKKIIGRKEEPIVFFTNITDLDDAEFLRGREVWVRKSILSARGIELPIELINASVYLSLKDGEKKMGIVSDITSGPGYEFLSVRTKAGHEELIPLIDEFIVEMDARKKRVVVSGRSGLFGNEV